jgi:hypothetical protein
MKTLVSVFRFQPVTLCTDVGDDEALLVFTREQLVAVLTRLSAVHGMLEGQWFLEAAFHEALTSAPSSVASTFITTGQFETWATERLPHILN